MSNKDDSRFDGKENWRTYPASQSSVFVPGERIADTLLTVIGPGFKDRYGRESYRQVKVLCDPQYGGCGKETVMPYYAVYQFPPRYSCGCARRRTWNSKDHTGESVTGYETGRKLTILYEDDKHDWVYVCECCGDTGTLPRGRGQTTFMKLKAEARVQCRNAPVFVWLEDTGVRRSTKFRPKEMNDAEYKADVEATFPGCKLVRDSYGLIVGIQATGSVVGPTIKRSPLPKGAVIQ